MHYRQSEKHVVMVGAFPPPVHGMAAVNFAVSRALQKSGAQVTVINLAAPNLKRTLFSRLSRLPIVLLGFLKFLFSNRLHRRVFYMSVSGGLGQVYEVLFVILARLRGMRITLHHHSFAYLDKYSPLTAIVSRVAGPDAIHVTQSIGMVERLKTLYEIRHAISISNAVFLLEREFPLDQSRKHLRTLGFISNLSSQKGVCEFLDLLALAQRQGLPLRGILAGPFQDSSTERMVRKRIMHLTNVNYVGPKYGIEKDAFFTDVDLFIFPTRYTNETEGIVNHEAMSHAIPVIAYGRGCIPEIVGSDCGLVIETDQPFVPNALAQIEYWIENSRAFEATSKAAAERFSRTYAESHIRWVQLLNELTRDVDKRASSP